MEMRLSKLFSDSDTKPTLCDKHQRDLKKRDTVAFAINFEHIWHINTLFNREVCRNYTD